MAGLYDARTMAAHDEDDEPPVVRPRGHGALDLSAAPPPRPPREGALSWWEIEAAKGGFANAPWFHGAIDRDEAVARLVCELTRVLMCQVEPAAGHVSDPGEWDSGEARIQAEHHAPRESQARNHRL